MHKTLYKYTSEIANKVHKYNDGYINFLDTYLDMISSDTTVGLGWPNNKNLVKNNLMEIFKNEESTKIKKYNGVIAYGQVQSGKTLNMISSMYYAYENNYKLVFVLTGNTDPLHKQTKERFELENKNLSKYIKDNNINNNPTNKIEIIRKSNFPGYSNIRMHDATYYKNQKNINFDDSINIITKDEYMHVFFVKKDITWYDEMQKIVSRMPKPSKQNRILILDDEADWGFEEFGSKPTDNDRLYDRLVNSKREVLNNGYYLKYIAFTATPYKIFENFKSNLINETEIDFLLKTKEIEDFTNVEEFIKYDPYYCGIDLFHKNQEYLKKFDEKIVELLKKEYITIFQDEEINESIYSISIFHFLINNYNYMKSIEFNSKRIKGSFKSLIFPSINTKEHKNVKNLMMEFISTDFKKLVESIINALNSGHNIKIFFNDFKKIFRVGFEAIWEKLDRLKFNNNLAFWIHLKNWIIENERNDFKNIVQFSGRENCIKDVEHNFIKVDGFEEVIFIGGNKLSRGVTFNNLTLETILHDSEKNDSTLQRARWFGFRSYLNLQNMDIIMSKTVMNTFNMAIKNDLLYRNGIIERGKRKNSN